MSGVLKSIGKVFKKVTSSTVGKIVLGALAVAAVVVTGGAALGLIPGITGLGGLAASLGASPLLAGVLSAAGTGATIGAIGGLISGKGILKGATTGLLVGAAAGGIGAALGGIGGAAGGIPAPDLAADAGVNIGSTNLVTGAVDGGLGQAASGLGTGVAGAVGSSGIGGAIAAGTPAAAAPGSGGVMGFLNSNPLLASGILKGIGGAFTGRPPNQLDLLRAEQKSYDGVIPYRPYDVGSIDGLQSPDQRFNTIIYGGGKYEYDPLTGRVLPAKQGA